MTLQEKKSIKLLEYGLQLRLLIDQHAQETEWATETGIRRSQQHQGRMAANVDYRKGLEKLHKKISIQRGQIQDGIKELKEENNVARIDHHRHKELA